MNKRFVVVLCWQLSRQSYLQPKMWFIIRNLQLLSYVSQPLNYFSQFFVEITKLDLPSFFYISFVQSSGQWQQCICQRHIGSASWIAIVLWHKTNGTVGISVVFILVNNRSLKFVLMIGGNCNHVHLVFECIWKCRKRCGVCFGAEHFGLKVILLGSARHHILLASEFER